MIEKNIFRAEIKNILLKYMEEGIVMPGERLSLPKIASELDVSVTPVREALTQLTETGIVTYKANRGFFVTELSEQEAIEIYEIIVVLESEAIKNSAFSAEQILQLRKINQSFKDAQSGKDKLRFDRLFHQKLIEKYSNTHAQKIIEDIRVRVFMYELKFMISTPSQESHEMHDKMINLLEEGAINKAVKELKSNWNISIKHITNSYKLQDHKK